MKQSTKRVVGWGAGMGIGAALLVLIAVLVMVMTAQPGAHNEAGDVQAVEAQAGEETAAATADDEAPACDYPQEWIGQPVDEAAVKAAFKSYRILKPDQPATMDYHAERRNVMIDDNGIVTEIRCG